MSPLEIGGVACLVWSVATVFVAVAKPKAIWQLDKLQGFVKILGETGATVFVGGAGLAAGVLGAWLLFGLQP